MPGVLLYEVKQHPLQRRRVRAVPSRAGRTRRRELVVLYHRAGMSALRSQRGDEVLASLLGRDIPSVLALITPRIADVAALKSPLDPAQFDVAQVLEQFQWSPSGRQPAAAQFVLGQRGHLRQHVFAEVVEVSKEHLG